MDLRLPKFAHLSTTSQVRALAKSEPEESLTWRALSLKTEINERICAGPNAGFYQTGYFQHMGTGRTWNGWFNQPTMMRRYVVGRKATWSGKDSALDTRRPTNLFLVCMALSKHET
jgi:hypothetical protein